MPLLVETPLALLKSGFNHDPVILQTPNKASDIHFQERLIKYLAPKCNQSIFTYKTKKDEKVFLYIQHYLFISCFRMKLKITASHQTIK